MLCFIVIVLIFGILFEKLYVIVVVGYQGVEIFENDLFYYMGMLVEICQFVVDLGLKIMFF